jgi:anti-sigma factor RsiW
LSAVLAREPESCEQIEVWLHLVVDGECGPEEQATVEHHLASCERCTHALRLLERTRAGLRQAALASEQPAPEALVGRIEGDIRAASSGPRRPVLIAAGLALFLLGAGAAGLVMSQLDNPIDPMVGDLVERHALEVPVDVASPDADRVASFFQPRLGEPVLVPGMHGVGLGLRGGRVVNVEGHRAAQIVYRAPRGERVSVIAIPDHDGKLTRRVVKTPPVFTGQHGDYQVGAVRVGPTLYTVIGKVPATTMTTFAHHLAR